MSLADLSPEDRAALLAEARGETAGPAGGFSIARDDTPDPQAAADGGESALDRKLADADAAEGADFDAYFTAQAPGKRLRNVCGQGNDLVLPRSMPLRFELESKRLEGRDDTESMRHLFDTLFGEGRWADLIERGIDGEQLPTLLTWATVNLSGVDMTLAQAHAEVVRMTREKAEGKAPAPPAALAATRGATARGATSAGSGG